MNVTANDIMDAWQAAIVQEAELSGATLADGPVDPQALGPDQLPYVTILNPESEVEMTEWQQRDTTLSWTAVIVARVPYSTMLGMIEAVEDRSEVNPTLGGKVRSWHVAHWAVYWPTEHLKMGILTISTNRIEP